MAVIGSYLDVVFEVSNKRINTFDNFSRNGDARYEKHMIKQQKPLLEFEGVDVDVVTFDIKLSASLGIKPLNELEKWRMSYRRGERGVFLVGRKPLSVHTYVINKITENHTTYDRNGNVQTIELSLELLEYPEQIKAQKKAKPKQSPTTAPASKKQTGTMTIIVKSVHIRGGPGTKYKVLGYAYRNDKLKVYGKKEGWYDLGGGKYITASSSYSSFKAVT